jgi:hypothetical protein
MPISPAMSSARIPTPDLRPRDVPVMHSTIRYTLVYIDILEKTLSESRKSNRQRPLSLDILAFGLDGSSSKS